MKKRIPAVLLAASMALSMLMPAWSAETVNPVTGSVQATVRIDYVQELAELQERDVQAELFQGKNSLGKVSLTKMASKRLGGYAAAVSLRDRLGGELTGSALPGALDLSVEGLPQGNYTLCFTGEGYTAYDVQFSIGSYHKYVEVGTGDATFTLGDVDGNGRVDVKDRDALSNALGSTARADLARYDLNGDGEINIVDLAYVNHNVSTPAAQATVLDTACIGVQLDAAQAAADLAAGGTVVRSGRMESLLLEDDSVTTFQNDTGEIRIPVPLSGAVQAEHLEIVTPDAASGAILEGLVEVEYNGGTITQRFSSNNAMYPGTHAITRTPGSNVITIPLGRRVAVKKITITVTKTAGGQYAAVESIRFLKDIVPEELVEPNSQVKNLSASAGDGQVSLIWNQLPNVSGYRVEYWQEGREDARRSLNVDLPRAQVTGLSNLKTYYFTVTPVDGSWQGRTCAPVEATPQPAKSPAAPDMVNVTALDGQLEVSWKKGENVTYYEVYYTDRAGASTSAYQQTGGRITGIKLTIPGLTNGTTYYIYVVAGNDVGKSGPSLIYAGTPVATDYSRPEGIPTEGILDSAKIKSIALADPSNYSASEYPNGSFDIRNVIDNDFRTHWTVKDWYHNEHVEVVFAQPVDLYGAIWTPRLDGSYPSNLRAYSVRVWYQGEDLNGEGHLLTGGVDDGNVGDSSNAKSWPEIPNNTAISRFAILRFEPVTNVAKISVAVEQRGYTTVSLSELMFLEYDPDRCLPDNISQLFADELHTQLAGGVTQTKIDALKARLNSDERNYYLNLQTLDDELALAQELLADGATKGVVLRGIQSRNSADDSKTYQQGGSNLQPLGVAAKAGQEITVYASGIPDGETVAVYATQFNAEASAWQAEMGTLVNGRNILTVPSIGSQSTEHGGSLYVTYSGNEPQEIQLHIRRAVDIPMLELSDWHRISDDVQRERIGAYVDELTAYVSAQGINSSNAEAKCLNVTELSMPSVLLSIPAAAALSANGQNRESKIENLYQNVLAWEELMHICKTTQGIDKTYADNDMTSRQNIRCMKMFAGAFMYAAGSHIGIGYKSCGGMVSGQPVAKLDAGATANHLFGWGIAHEIGHNMDKLGRAEITNNLYSLMVQTYDGDQNTFASRLEVSGKYPAIFTKTAQGWPGESNDVFVQLGMYWQLHLAYDNGSAPMDFYNRFFKAWKAGTYTQGMSGLSYDEKVALTACGVAGKDLTEFFERWGMTLSDEVKAKLAAYEKESRAVWYLSDQSRRDRLGAAVPARGSLTAQAELDGENKNKVVVTITPSITGNVQGYEIVRNREPIAFVLPRADGTAVYEDVIGSGNHRTYQYQVIAYDTLGRRITQLVNDGITEAGTVRVAYDKTVDPSSYTMTRDGTTVTIRFQDSISISGLKLTGADRPKTGDYTVSIQAKFTVGKDADEKTVEKTVTARTGSFDIGNQAIDDTDCYLTYFQKPDVTTDDTRIWTYDAKTVTITGVPTAMKDGEIQLVSYAGDDVAFLEGGSVGRLSADYRYGEGAEDVIAEGTLVIVGTYRGDPRYNTVKIEGRFSKTTAEDSVETTYEDRWLDGYTLMFAEIPEDKQVSDISDGLFIFVPNVQKEAELQESSRCNGINLLPSQMRAVLSRTDVPDSADSQRVTAETLWVGTPGGTDLPTIVLEGGNG